MSLNWKEIDLILAELDMENSHIQKIRQPDYKTLVIDLYKPGDRFSLLISLNQGKVRLHRLSRKIQNKVPLQRFAQLLRSRINGGRITEAQQLGKERIVLLKIIRADETTILYLRLWGGNPNIIAVGKNGTILDAFFRRPGKEETSGETYFPEIELKKVKKKNTGEKEFSVRPYDERNTFNSFIEQYYSDLENIIELKELNQRINRILEAKETQLLSSLEALEERIAAGSQYELYRQQAELLKSNLYRIFSGMEEITVENYFQNNDTIIIKLDSRLSPSENAEKLFKKYKKEKAGLENLKNELANVKAQIRKIEYDRERLFSKDTDIETSIDKLKSFLSSIPKQITVKEKEKIPGLQFVSGRFTIYVGRTAAENDLLLRKHVKGNDYWLHTRDFPGGYVFIKYIRGKSIPLETLLDAGNLALFFSKGRKNGQGELYYTQVKYLRRAKQGKKGLVLPTQEKNLSLRLDKQRLNVLLGRETYSEEK